MSPKRISYYLGYLAELFAGLVLRMKGYHILAWRYKTHLGEIDWVVLDGDVVVFLEVKYRSTPQEGLFALTNAQGRRIVQASDVFLQKQFGLWGRPRRYDLFLVGPFYFRHMHNAWQN